MTMFYLAGAAAGLYTTTAIIAKHNGLAGLKPPSYTRPARHRVSLIIPALEEAEYIKLLLRSAKNQTEPIAEMIVVDSSPPGDPTAAVAQEMGAKVVPFPKGNISAARNAGAAEASGEIIIFCDADVVMGSRLVERSVTAMRKGYALAHPREGLYDSDGWNFALWGAQVVRPRWNTTRCVTVTRAVFEKVGGYSPACNPYDPDRCREDLNFGARVSKIYGYRSIKVLGPLIATSARRYKKFGTEGLTHFDIPARAVRRVT